MGNGSHDTWQESQGQSSQETHSQWVHVLPFTRMRIRVSPWAREEQVSLWASRDEPLREREMETALCCPADHIYSGENAWNWLLVTRLAETSHPMASKAAPQPLAAICPPQKAGTDSGAGCCHGKELCLLSRPVSREGAGHRHCCHGAPSDQSG